MSRIFEVSVSLPPEDCFINLVSDTFPSDTIEPSMTINLSTSQSQTEDPILTPPPCTPTHPAKRERGRPALISETEDPILTPPPCTPPLPAKRGRPALRSQTEDPILTPPPCTPPHPAKRGRLVLSSPSPPPAKRGRGRPPVQRRDAVSPPPAKLAKGGGVGPRRMHD